MALAREMSRRGLLLGVMGVTLDACTKSGVANFTSTRLAKPPTGLKLDPPPPERLYWVRVMGAELPVRNSGGQLWDEGGLPDPYFVLTLEGKKLMQSEPQSDQPKPTWPDGPRGNIELPKNALLALEIFESDPVEDLPMAKGTFGPPVTHELAEGHIEVDLGKGRSARIAVGKARALFGLGFHYEMRGEICWVKQALKHSPVGRAGMRDGDYIVAIDGKRVSAMDVSTLRSIFNSVPSKGLALVVQHGKNAGNERIEVKEGPVYPLYSEFGSMD